MCILGRLTGSAGGQPQSPQQSRDKQQDRGLVHIPSDCLLVPDQNIVYASVTLSRFQIRSGSVFIPPRASQQVLGLKNNDGFPEQ